MVQVSLALVLLVGAGLMIHSFLRQTAIETGANTDGLMSFQVRFDSREYIHETGETTPSGSRKQN